MIRIVISRLYYSLIIISIRSRNGDLTDLQAKENDSISELAVLRYTSNVSDQFWNIIGLPCIDVWRCVRENSYYNIRRRNDETRSE